MEDLPVGLIQASIIRKSPESNRAALLAETDRIGKAGAKIAILPELWNVTFHGACTKIPSVNRDDYLDTFRAIARRHRMSIVAGSVAVSDNDGKLNRCQVLGPDGENRLVYDKLHVFPSFFSPGAFKPGNRLGLCEISGWKTGIQVCFDIEFPELSRALVGAGAKLLIVVGAWPSEHVRLWKTFLVARAAENQVYVIGVNRCDQGSATRFGGQSLVVDPFGDIILQLDDRPATEIVTLRHERVPLSRKMNAVWSSRREELYRKWL
jgi:predicted amidohydrolase